MNWKYGNPETDEIVSIVSSEAPNTRRWKDNTTAWRPQIESDQQTVDPCSFVGPAAEAPDYTRNWR
jgi:hypothetical protein